MVNIGVREKIMVVFVSLLFIPLVLLGVVSVIGVLDVGKTSMNNTTDALSEQARANLMRIVQDKANETNNFFAGIESDTNVLMNYGNDVYNHPEKYHNGTNYPTYDYKTGTVDYLPSWGYVHSADDERKGAWGDWEGNSQACPYLNSSVVNQAANNPSYAAWLRDEIDKTVLFDHTFKPIYDKNQPNVVLVWMVRLGGLTNSYSVPPLDYGQMLRDEDLTDDWDEDAEDYVTLANAKNNPSKGIVWTDPYFDTVGNGWMISALGPLYSGNTFIGDVGIDIQLNTIQDIVLGVKILDTGHAFLINQDGVAISHPDLAKTRSDQIVLDEEDTDVPITKLESNTGEFQAALTSMTNLEKGFKLVTFEDGTTQYVAYAPIPSTEFSIGVVVSEEEINALVEETEEKMSAATTISIVVILAVVAGTIIAAVVASVVLASRITKPIKQLTVLADRITEGNLSFEFTEDYNDEMRTLAQTFQNLLVTLRLGNVAYYEGDTHRAFENYKSALSLFNATGNKKGQSMALNNLGNIYRNWKDHKQARRHYEKAIQLDKGAKNISGEASRYVNIGLLYEEQGDDPTARKYYQQALALYKKAKDQRGEARVYNNMGLLRADSGDLQGALDYFIRAHEIDMVLNDRRGLSTRLNNMAIIYKKSRQYQKAINLLKNSMELSESYEDKTGVMNNLSNIAQTYKEMGDYKSSEAYQKRFEKLRDQVLKTTKKKSVIFVIDTSGSMEGERLDSAKEGALNMYKRKIYDEDLVSLVEFHSKSVVVFPLKKKAGAEKEFNKGLHKLYADGMTAFYDALGDALSAVRKSSDANMSYWIVALTDGEDNSSFRFTRRSVIQMRDTTPQDVTLVIISVGDVIMQSQLEELCGAKGRYIVVGQEGDAKIGQEIRKAYKEVEDIFESAEVVEGFVPEG